MNEVWFCLLVFMLGNYVVLGGTDLGVGILHLFVARKETERAQVIQSIHPLWKPNEVWLIAAGGTMFMAFPTALASSFSGFYLALTIVVWLMAFRALSLELRHHVQSELWSQFWDATLALSSLLLAVFLGTALGNVVRGVPLDAKGIFFEPLWTDFRVGKQTGILDWYTILAGVTAVIALAHHGALWLNATTDGAVRIRANYLAARLALAVIVLLAVLDLASFAARLEFRDALRSRPWGMFFPALTLGALVISMVSRARGKPGRAYIGSCLALFGAFATAAVGMFPNILPARDPSLSLSVYDPTVAREALTLALCWWIPGILLVTGYFVFIHRQAAGSLRPSRGSGLQEAKASPDDGITLRQSK